MQEVACFLGWYPVTSDTRIKGHLGATSTISPVMCWQQPGAAFSVDVGSDAQKPPCPRRNGQCCPRTHFPIQKQTCKCHKSILGTTLECTGQGWHFHEPWNGSAPVTPSSLLSESPLSYLSPPPTPKPQIVMFP